jgi:hypothetical protein
MTVCVARSARAEGDESLGCEIYEIKAVRDGDKIDPELKPLERKLSQPPFSSWKSFSLLKKHNESVSRMRALNVKLVPGSQMQLLYLGMSKEAGKKDRLRLEFTLDDSSGKRTAKATLAVDVGDFYAVVGDPLSGGGHHILAVACVPR